MFVWRVLEKMNRTVGRNRIELLAVGKSMLYKTIFLLQTYKDRTFDNPGLPPGGWVGGS